MENGQLKLIINYPLSIINFIDLDSPRTLGIPESDCS